MNEGPDFDPAEARSGRRRRKPAKRARPTAYTTEWCGHSMAASKQVDTREHGGARIRKRRCTVCGRGYVTREVSDFPARLLWQGYEEQRAVDRSLKEEE